MSARTIIAAPVIWFGSWLLSVMACSGCAVPARLRQFQFWEIKKGPRGPMHTARIWMASATPGGAPGYDYDKEFGNNITHSRVHTCQRLRGYTAQSPKVKGRTPIARLRQLSGVPGVRRVGFLCVQACSPKPAVIPGRSEGPDLRGAIAPWTISRFRVRSFHERPGMNSGPATPSPLLGPPIRSQAIGAGTR